MAKKLIITLSIYFIIVFINGSTVFAEPCISVDDNLSMFIPCADYQDFDFSFLLDYFENTSDPFNAYWKMDLDTFAKSTDGSCINVDSNLHINIPCARFMGTKYWFTLDYYYNPSDPYGVYWIMDLNSFGVDTLGGIYKMQQKSTGRYVDAYLDSDHDYTLVCRGPQEDDTQKWIFKKDKENIYDNVYTIQQKINGRYVDAYESLDLKYKMVTRELQNNDSQKWILTNLNDNVYSIQQKSTGRYADAYEVSSENYKLFTELWQGDYSQQWILTWIPEDMEFIDVDYSLDKAEIVDEEPLALGFEYLENNSPVEQEMTFEISERVTETSYFEHSAGVSVTVGLKLSCGTPKIGAEGSLEISAYYDYTWGKEETISKTYTASYPLKVAPYSTYKATAVVQKASLSVPFVMHFKLKDTGVIREARGIWNGVTTWNLHYKVDDVTKK